MLWRNEEKYKIWKKNLIIYLSKEYNWKLSYPFEFHNARLQNQIEDFISVFPQDKVDIYYAQTHKSHIQNNDFIVQFYKWEYTWVACNRKITADFVYGSYIPQSVTHKLDASLKKLFIDKVQIENIFQNHALSSIICPSYEDIQKYFWKIQSPFKVLKPQYGTRGRWIFIQEHIPQKKEITEDLYPYILQEFFDTSRGIFGYHWYHDFRVIILNGSIIWKVLRQPENSWFISNTAQSGTVIDLENFWIPESIECIIDEVDDYLWKLSKERFYSIDFWVWISGEIKIFEMNGNPALSFPLIAHRLWTYIAKNILKVK